MNKSSNIERTYNDKFNEGFYIGKRISQRDVVIKMLRIDFPQLNLSDELLRDINRATYSQLKLIFYVMLGKMDTGKLTVDDIYKYL